MQAPGDKQQFQKSLFGHRELNSGPQARQASTVPLVTFQAAQERHLRLTAQS